ncbi:hypothetical protein JQ582_34935 [Bradyrhizobium japonicum]|uniref:hypothetical protein n=1 Tax=Bradyrhizobium japonicum TaxID=375 RepID=UPI001BA8B01E|nr:hypothetical protein [Bradyrhizobium japonicum]MBR0749137.1 hypothetical protein [Bradyrhizobium japonicum]
MISVVTEHEVLGQIFRSTFAGRSSVGADLSDELLAQLARRAVAFTAPCAAHELVRAICQSFAGSNLFTDALSDRVERIVEDLIVYGDILEMRPVEGGSWSEEKGFVLLPAPPSFVARSNGSVAILGVAGDQITPLTAELETLVTYRGALRVIPAPYDTDLHAHLVELGLLRLSEKTWLRLPPSEPASVHIASWLTLLSREPACPPFEGLEILDTKRSPTFYKDRWCKPDRQHSGSYVARRPQRYGASLWCLAELENGALRRFKDLNIPGDRLRPIDIAWRIQAAFDASAQTPQRYRCSASTSSMSLLRFYAPVPSWCERHLSIVGQKTKADRCLFSFEIPTSQLASEIKFLRDALWMAETTD